MPDERLEVIEIALRLPSSGTEAYLPIRLNIDWAADEFNPDKNHSGIEANVALLSEIRRHLETALEERSILFTLLSCCEMLPDGKSADITPALEEYEKS
jgi:hypothetical protein